MREPKYSDFNSIADATWTGEDAVYELVDGIGLPEEVAARFYAYLVDNSCLSPTAVLEYYNKSWT